MRIALVFAWFMLIYLGTLLVNTPATLIHSHLPRHWQSSLVSVSGLLRQGEGYVGRSAGFSVPIQWSLAPWQLWKGCLTGVLRAANSPVDAPMTWCPFAPSMGVTDLRFALEAGQLAELAALPASTVRGQVMVNITELRWTMDTVAASGQIQWTGAEVNVVTPITLGQVTVQIRPTTNGVSAEVTNGGGPDVVLELAANIDITGRYQVAGLVKPMATEFAGYLASLGQRRADGNVDVRLQGQILKGRWLQGR